MPKPSVSSYYAVQYILEDESSIHIISSGKSFKTIKFPKGTEINIFVSKQPIIEEDK